MLMTSVTENTYQFVLNVFLHATAYTIKRTLRSFQLKSAKDSQFFNHSLSIVVFCVHILAYL